MITEESKEFLGEKVKLDDKLGIIVGLTEIPNYSPYIYNEDRTLIIVELIEVVLWEKL